MGRVSFKVLKAVGMRIYGIVGGLQEKVLKV